MRACDGRLRLRIVTHSPRGSVKSPTFVLIASSAYSGSTLLASLLGTHPDIATVSEVAGRRRETQMDTFRCSCQRLMTDCPFWLAVLAAMRERGYHDFKLGNFALNFSRAPNGWLERARSGSLRWSALEDLRDRLFSIVPSHAAALRDIGSRNRSFAETILAMTDTKVFVDASKERMRIRYLNRYLGMDVKVIHLIRDVRGVVDSVARHAGLPIDLAGAAQDWASTNRTLLRHIKRMAPSQHRLVRYEDLCAAPEATLAALYQFCGVDPNFGMRSTDDTMQHLLGNARRLEAGWSQIRLDERWRTSLGAGDLSRIMAGAGDIGRRFYPELMVGIGPQKSADA
jgi:sulfotransferase family protein